MKASDFMSLWFGDYLKLKNEICYLEFKLADERLTSEEIKETEKQLEERLFREGEFKIIVNAFGDLESEILRKKYIEGMTLDRIATESDYSPNYIYNKHAALIQSLKIYGKINNDLKTFKNNFSRKRKSK